MRTYLGRCVREQMRGSVEHSPGHAGSAPRECQRGGLLLSKKAPLTGYPEAARCLWHLGLWSVSWGRALQSCPFFRCGFWKVAEWVLAKPGVERGPWLQPRLRGVGRASALRFPVSMAVHRRGWQAGVLAVTGAN